MSAALRFVQTTPSMRPMGAAFAGIAVVATLAGVLAFGQSATSRPQDFPAAAAAPVIHDHGWSSAPAAAAVPVIHDHGWSSAPAAPAPGVPYHRGWISAPPAPAEDSRPAGSGGSNGTRFAK